MDEEAERKKRGVEEEGERMTEEVERQWKEIGETRVEQLTALDT